MISLKYFKYLKLLFWKKNVKLPVYLSVFITNKCSYKCKHCFYWKNLNKPDELSLNQIEKLSKSVDFLINLGITGGEPFLREDIDKVINLFYQNLNPLVVTITTNGYDPKKILQKTNLILENNPHKPLTILISLDGPKKVHDAIRGVKGAYKNAIITYKKLKILKESYPTLNIGFLSTISLDNYSTFFPFFKETLATFQPDSFNVNYLRGSSRLSKVSPLVYNIYEKAIKFTAQNIFKQPLRGYSNFGMSQFYHAANLIYRQLLLRMLKNPRYYIPCYAGLLNGVIYPNGDVAACEIKDFKIGNLYDFDFNLKDIWSSEQAKKIRHTIRKQKCFCTHECQMTTNTIFNIRYFLKIAQKYIHLKFGDET